MPGVSSISRSPMASVGIASPPAPRRMRSTLYCCGVMPCGSSTAATARRNESAVLSTDRNASCQTLRNEARLMDLALETAGGFRHEFNLHVNG